MQVMFSIQVVTLSAKKYASAFCRVSTMEMMTEVVHKNSMKGSSEIVDHLAQQTQLQELEKRSPIGSVILTYECNDCEFLGCCCNSAQPLSPHF